MWNYRYVSSSSLSRPMIPMTAALISLWVMSDRSGPSCSTLRRLRHRHAARQHRCPLRRCHSHGRRGVHRQQRSVPTALELGNTCSQASSTYTRDEVVTSDLLLPIVRLWRKEPSLTPCDQVRNSPLLTTCLFCRFFFVLSMILQIVVTPKTAN